MKKLANGFFAFILLSLFVFSAQAQAAQYDIKTMTPEIEQAVSNRQNRYNNLQDSKTQGSIGENNQGYVHALDSSPAAAELVNAENSDRRVIYQAIADQNNLGPNGLSLVEGIFSEVLEEKSTPGQTVQAPDGSWKKK